MKMNGRGGFGQWQRSELERYLKKNRKDPLLDSKAVFLVNPKKKAELDRVIKEEFWPAILDALAPTSILVADMADGFPLSGIEDYWSTYICRSFEFMLEDPNRPLLPGSGPPWFCRGHLQCSPMDYLISFDFFVHLPISFSFRRILRFLGDQMFSGNPPNLTMERGMKGETVFVIAFTEGSGAGWGIRNYDQAAEHLREKVKQNVEVIEAVYVLEKDWNSTAKFKALHAALREAYQAF